MYMYVHVPNSAVSRKQYDAYHRTVSCLPFCCLWSLLFCTDLAVRFTSVVTIDYDYRAILRVETGGTCSTCETACSTCEPAGRLDF